MTSNSKTGRFCARRKMQRGLSRDRMLSRTLCKLDSRPPSWCTESFQPILLYTRSFPWATRLQCLSSRSSLLNDRLRLVTRRLIRCITVLKSYRPRRERIRYLHLMCCILMDTTSSRMRSSIWPWRIRPLGTWSLQMLLRHCLVGADSKTSSTTTPHSYRLFRTWTLTISSRKTLCHKQTSQITLLSQSTRRADPFLIHLLITW